MTAIDTARRAYADEAESPLTGRELVSGLREQAEAVRVRDIDRVSEETRQGVAQALREGNADAVSQTANAMEQAARDLEDAFDGSNPLMEELPEGVAGQATLGANTISIDGSSMKSGESEDVIDAEKLEDVMRHEEEHTMQTPEADREGIMVGGRTFDAREIREAAAISVQERTDFLSAEYQQITAALPMNAADRQLVREGRFHDLEAKKNGRETALAV